LIAAVLPPTISFRTCSTSANSEPDEERVGSPLDANASTGSTARMTTAALMVERVST